MRLTLSSWSRSIASPASSRMSRASTTKLQFHGMSLHAVNVGAVTTMHVGMLGTMAQMFLSDLREKTKRGQLGRVL